MKAQEHRCIEGMVRCVVIGTKGYIEEVARRSGSGPGYMCKDFCIEWIAREMADNFRICM